MRRSGVESDGAAGERGGEGGAAGEVAPARSERARAEIDVASPLPRVTV